MNTIINGEIVDFTTFWGPIEIGSRHPYNNNFYFNLVQKDFCIRRIIEILKQKALIGLRINEENAKEIAETVIPQNFGNKYGITEEDILQERKRTVLVILSLGEYIRCFGIKAFEIEEKTDINELSENVKYCVYEIYSYLRTQPGTYDALFCA